MPESAPTYQAMRQSEQLIRRARLRRLLNTHTGANGYPTAQAIAEQLDEHEQTVRNDLQAIGAVKIKDTINGKHHAWWIIPAYNPLLPNLRDYMSETALLNEISLKIRAHVLEMFRYKSEIIIKTERSAGPLLADWISLLPWAEILHVSEERNSAVVRCLDPDAAEDVLARLLGEPPEDEHA